MCAVKMHILIFVVATRLCFKHLSVMSFNLHGLHEWFGMIYVACFLRNLQTTIGYLLHIHLDSTHFYGALHYHTLNHS